MISCKNLLSKLVNFPAKTFLKNREYIAICEGLDEVVEIEDSSPGAVEYLTVHGNRTLNSDRPELNQFLVLIKGDGFARAVPLPYIRTYNSSLGIPHLVVQYSHPDAPATIAGYAQAVDLPGDCSEVYVHDLGILDTYYAAMLANLL